jgi:hypothetical protein
MLLIVLAFVAFVVYGVYRATKRWGTTVLYFLTAGISFLDASGVLADHVLGARWSWNFAHHNSATACGSLAIGMCFLCAGVLFRGARQQNPT